MKNTSCRLQCVHYMHKHTIRDLFTLLSVWLCFSTLYVFNTSRWLNLHRLSLAAERPLLLFSSASAFFFGPWAFFFIPSLSRENIKKPQCSAFTASLFSMISFWAPLCRPWKVNLLSCVLSEFPVYGHFVRKAFIFLSPWEINSLNFASGLK